MAFARFARSTGGDTQFTAMPALFTIAPLANFPAGYRPARADGQGRTRSARGADPRRRGCRIVGPQLWVARCRGRVGGRRPQMVARTRYRVVVACRGGDLRGCRVGLSGGPGPVEPGLAAGRPSHAQNCHAGRHGADFLWRRPADAPPGARVGTGFSPTEACPRGDQLLDPAPAGGPRLRDHEAPV